MKESAHFVNDGTGWECRRCRAAGGGAAEEGESQAPTLPRFFREGEAENGAPRLSARARARWADESRKALRCPACGVEEEFKG